MLEKLFGQSGKTTMKAANTRFASKFLLIGLVVDVRGVARISDWGGAWCERSELHLGVWGLAPSENFKITVYSDRLYSMRDPLQ